MKRYSVLACKDIMKSLVTCTIAQWGCVLLSVIVASSCATSMTMIRNPETVQIGQDTHVVLVEPVVEFKDMRNDYTHVTGDTVQLASYIQAHAQQVLSRKGFIVTTNDSVNALVIRLKNSDPTFDIYKSTQGPEGESILKQLTELVGSSYVLLIKVSVYQGPGGGQCC